MPDLVDQLVARIESQRLPDLDLGPDAIHPAYDGLSILNLPGSLSHWLGGPDLSHPPIDIPQLDALANGVQQVVCVLIDAVSLHRFRTWYEGLIPALDSDSDSTILGSLTSVVPSTTSAALTTLWTGRSPSEHGILGYELFLREYGLVANMITHSPMVFEGTTGLLYRAGFRPESALPVPTLGPQYSDADIKAHAFLANSIRHSGLSRMHYESVQIHGFGAPSELWIGVRELAETPIEHRRLIWVYYGGVDGLSHRFGPDSEQASADFKTFLRAMNEHFISSMSGTNGKRTLLLLISDHGQVLTPFDPQFEVRNHPSLVRRLHILPTGENRLSYFYPQPGQIEAVQEYFEETFPGKFSLFPSEFLLKAGLFGPGKPAGATPGRMGDLAAISHGSAYLWWAFKENPLVGRHGGLSSEEMLVPLLAARLG